MSHRYEEQSGVVISLPWNGNTFRGFVVALCCLAIFLWSFWYFKITIESVSLPPEKQTIPIEILTLNLEELRIGKKIGQGPERGDKKAEGAKAVGTVAPVKGQAPQAPKLATITKKANVEPVASKDLSSKIKPVKTKETDKKPNNLVDSKVDKKSKDLITENTSTNATGLSKNNGSSSVGHKDGETNGTGNGFTGGGTGRGLGVSDLVFPGGGNRTVISKINPKFPSNVDKGSIVKIQFRVLPDGSVGLMSVRESGDPRLTDAAKNALSRWKFNPIEGEQQMVGVITFNFTIN